MTYYWIKFTDGSKACVDAIDEQEALSLAESLSGKKPVQIIGSLPYPTSPRLYNRSGCPSFCFSPERCVGHSCCPRSIACND